MTDFNPLSFDPVPARGKLEQVTKHPFSCEAKLDGVRQVITIRPDGEILMTGRRDSVHTGQKLNKAAWVPHLCDALRTHLVPTTGVTVLDGELYIKRGTSNEVVSIFGSSLDKALQRQLEPGCALTFRLFDVLFLSGEDIREVPLVTRYRFIKTVAQQLAECGYGRFFAATPVYYHALDHGTSLGATPELIIAECYQQAIERGFEGLVVKALDGTYDKHAWAKVKPTKTYDYVFVGIDESTSETYAGWGAAALILGLYDSSGKLISLTRCSGMTEQWRAEFFTNRQAYVGKVVEVVAQQQFPTGALRHPRFKGLRPDLNGSEQTLEKYNLHVSDIVAL
jgi:ATP-dependent DNA ligase